MQYDVIGVGAGSAGGILATRLTEDPNRSVLLLEAGPDYPDFESLPDVLKYSTTEVAFEKGAVHDWGYVGFATATRAEPMRVPRRLAPSVFSVKRVMPMACRCHCPIERWCGAKKRVWTFSPHGATVMRS